MHWLSRLNIRFRCRFIGQDDFGNRYYESKARRSDSRPRRYVIYKGKLEASKVPSDWHGWLHYTESAPPPEGGYARASWQRAHVPNLTGTHHAYHPAGHLLGQGRRRRATGDYQAWNPQETQRDDDA